MQKIVFYFFLGGINLISVLPMRLIYIISDFIRVLLYISGYRRKVVKSNLAMAFPEKSEKERDLILRKFYKNFADIMIETAKGFSLDPEKEKNRILFSNPELVNAYFEQGKHIIISMAHYSNWEWLQQYLPVQIKHGCAALYKPLNNIYIDNYIKSKRATYGFKLASIANTRVFFAEIFKQEPHAIVMISDQGPSNVNKAVWVDFLNSETPCLPGVEFYAKYYNMPVVFLNIVRISRGRYVGEFSLITDQPKETKPDEITRLFMKKVEEEIIKIPYLWLWSHRRWKRAHLKPNLIKTKN